MSQRLSVCIARRFEAAGVSEGRFEDRRVLAQTYRSFTFLLRRFYAVSPPLPNRWQSVPPRLVCRRGVACRGEDMTAWIRTFGGFALQALLILLGAMAILVFARDGFQVFLHDAFN